VTPANLKPPAATADALAWVDAHRACLGWRARAGARRNGWRFFAAGELPPAEARFSLGVLSVASAATRWGRWGARIDDVLAGRDRLLSPWTRQHAVHLHVYRRPA